MTVSRDLNYINDYVTLSGGGSGQSVTDRYKQYIQEILDSGAKVDGIGFQCHIGVQPTSILKIQATHFRIICSSQIAVSILLFL